MHAPMLPRAQHVTPAQNGGSRQFLDTIWRRRTIVAIVSLLVAGVVSIELATAPREYVAVARVAATPPAGATQSPANYSDLLGTIADVAASRPVLTEVATDLGTRSLAELEQDVTGSVVTGTLLVQISVTDRDPVMAARIANAIVSDLPTHNPTQGSYVLTSVEPAVVPATFSSPNIKITVLAGFVLALVLAVAAAFGYDRLARTIETAADADRAAGVGVLGILPRPAEVASVAAGDSTRREFPSLRALRVALEFASSEHPTRTLVIAPVVRDPWNGWLEVNLAVALAEVGHHVLLIDANRDDRSGVRHPALEGSGSPGLYGILAGEVLVEQAVIAGASAGVTFLPLGNPDVAASTLLEMQFGRLLETLGEAYDLVLVRAAPVTESDDARIMAIDGAMLLTIPSDRVKPATLQRAVDGLRAVRTNILGAVLLGSKTERA